MSLKEVAAQLKEKVNLVDFISEHVPLRKVGRNYQGLCPFHSDSKPSFTVSEEKQIFRCFGCGAGGDLIGFYMKLTGLSFAEAVKDLARKYGIPLPERTESASDKKRAPLYELNEKARRFYQHLLETSPQAAVAREYLKERGLSGATTRTFSLGYAPPDGGALVSHLRLLKADLALAEQAGLIVARGEGSYYDRFRGRLLFPWRDQQGRVVAFGGRILGAGEPKYLNSPESPIYHKGRLLYGLYEARSYIREKDQGLLVEGYFDLLSLWEHGLRNVVACSGTALTSEQVKILRRLSRNWFLIFDADPAGRKAAFRAVGLFFKEGLFPRVVFLPPGEDPDSLVRKDPGLFLRQLEASQEALPFLLHYLEEEYGRSPEGKSALLRELRPLLEAIPDAVVRHEYFRWVAEKLSLPLKVVLSKSPSQISFTSDSGVGLSEKVLLQFLVHHPHYLSQIESSVLEDLLPTPEGRALLKKLKEALEEGYSLETLTLEEAGLQALYSELLFSPPPEDSPEVIWAHIQRYLWRQRLRQEQAAMLAAIKEAEARGQKESLQRLLEEYRRLCGSNPLKGCGEGRYEPTQKGN